MTSHEGFELIPQFDSRKSFYKKAWVIPRNGKMVLKSYNTEVAEINQGKALIKGLYSPTTTRHIKEFLKQQNIKVDTTKDLKKLMGEMR